MHVPAVLLALVLALPALAQETRPFTDSLGRTVEVPAEPRRIAALHDSWLTLPLIELGVVPVASHGRQNEGGEPFIRSGIDAMGVDFASAGIAFVGTNPVDVEAVAAAEPDLIVTTLWQTADVDRLQAIAPTVVLADQALTQHEMYEALAELTGTRARHDTLRRRHDANIARLRAEIDGRDLCGAMIRVRPEGIDARDWRGPIDQVLRDAGIARPPIFGELDEAERRVFSIEQLPAFDCDFLLSFHADTRGESAADAWAAFEAESFPGACEALHACREGQMHFMALSDLGIATYDTLHGLTMTLSTLLTGRPLARFER